jgi:hypothetical protein
MGFAISRLGWRPNDFWRSTPHEFWAAYEVIEEGAKKAR